MQKVCRGERVGSSDPHQRRKELLEAHKEFLELLNNGYKINSIRPKRKRIPVRAEFKLFGTIKMDVPVEILKGAGFYK